MTKQDNYPKPPGKFTNRIVSRMKKGYLFYLLSLFIILAAGTQHANAQMFSAGTTQTDTVCANSIDSVNALLTVTDTVAGESITWSTSLLPANGTLTASYSATSVLGANVPTGLSYIPNPGFSGADTFTVMAAMDTIITYTTVYVTVNPLPDAGTISGAASVCIGATATFTATATGGTWSVSNTAASVAAGVVTGVSTGTDTVMYTVVNSCGSATADTTVIVDIPAVAGAITGNANVCAGGSTIILSDTITTGTWSASNGNATIATDGTVTGVTGGTVDTISYTVTTGCSTAATTKAITIDSILTNTGTIFGTYDTICVAALATYMDTVSGGTWSASNAHATITSSGLTIAVTAGLDTISYTFTNSCGSIAATKDITILTTPVAGIITGANAVCVGSTITLADTATGGMWSASNANATISTSGVVTGVSNGTDTITYQVTNICGSISTTYIINVDTALTTVGTISGGDSVCTGSTTSFVAAVTGGTWTASNTSASVAGGIVTGVTPGIDTITYTLTNSCGSIDTSKAILVDVPAVAGVITGANAICISAVADTLNDTVTTGTWSISNANAAISTSGVVTPVSGGLDTVSYTVTTGCGMAAVTYIVSIDTILTNAGTISGGDSVCTGATTSLSASVAGGTWTASNTSASVAGGVVTGVTPGMDTITYTLTNSCGSIDTTQAILVDIPAVAGVITGANAVCISAVADTLNDTVTTGTWSISNANATISTGGIVTPVTGGLDTVSYTVTTGCGMAVATYVISVDTTLTTAGTISGGDSVCTGSITSFVASVSGGTWTASNTSASVAGGVVTGVTPGIDTITYTLMNTCGSIDTSKAILVDIPAVAGVITGANAVCISAVADTLNDTVTTGTWSISNANATISTSGIVTPVTGGLDTVSYTVTTGCGMAVATYVISVDTTLTTAGTISGLDTICTLATTTFTASVAGGTWTASNGNASVLAGVVTGVTAGADTITYTLMNSCGSINTSEAIVVSTPAIAGVITGATNVCVGATTPLADTITGGAWTVSNSNATVGTDGVVTGVTGGTDTVIYTVNTVCGAASVSQPITINPLPVAATVSGITSICIATTATLTPTVGGGTWSATNGKATVADSVVTGVSAGMDTIIYTLSNACGNTSDSTVVTVNSGASAGTISATTTTICQGATTTYTESVTGGTWSTALGFASVSTAGVVTGISGGIDTVKYTVVATCGASVATKLVTVNGLPATGTITGGSTICTGSTINLADAATAGGTWSITNSNATITSSGVVAGITAGTDTVIYALSNSCGNDSATEVITVYMSADAGVISGGSSLCTTGTLTLSETVTGGSWSSSNANATVSTGGVVTAVSAGLDTILYSVSTVCGSAQAMHAMTINLTPLAGTISGTTNVCTGGTTTLSTTGTGGNWTTSNGDATVSTGGVVTGVAGGIDTITYTVTTVCGTSIAQKAVTVNIYADSGTITGGAIACTGAMLTLADAVTGGVWSASNGNATIGTGGVVTGVTVGTDTITYTVTTPCSSAMTSEVITINLSAFAGGITGSSSAVCTGATLPLTDTTSGGVWSALNGNVTVDDTGAVTGVANGTDVIYYTVTNSCGPVSASYAITINAAAYAGIITPDTPFICQDGNMLILESVGGGTWNTTNPDLTIVGSTLTGITPGIDTITYSVTNICGTAVATYVMPILTTLQCDSILSVGTVTPNAAEFKVYPNPSTGVFTIDIPQTGSNATITIMDLTGKVIMTKNVANNQAAQATIDISNLPSGNYIIKADAGDKTYRGKITLMN